MSAERAAKFDQFAIHLDGRMISLSHDRKKARKIARHFKRLQPTSTIMVRDLATKNVEEI